MFRSKKINKGNRATWGTISGNPRSEKLFQGIAVTKLRIKRKTIGFHKQCPPVLVNAGVELDCVCFGRIVLRGLEGA